MSLLKNVRIVLLECPYDQWSEVSELFGRVVGLKIQSYGSVYPYGILPVDASDFVGDHLLLCREEGEKLHPFATYRSITLERVIIHRLKFPLQNMLEGCKAETHLKALRKIMARHGDKPDTLAYQSGWTIDPALRADKEVGAEIKSMMTALVCSYSRHNGLKEIVGAGSCRFKADQYFMKWGFEGFSDETGELPLLKVPSFYDEESRIIRCTQFSAYSLEESARWQELWNNRLVLRAPETRTEKKAA